MVRVKRCGKSAPPAWRHGGQGKPHTEQGQIGGRLRLARPKPPGRSLDPAGNRGARGMIATVASKGAAVQDPAYRPAPAELSSQVVSCVMLPDAMRSDRH